MKPEPIKPIRNLATGSLPFMHSSPPILALASFAPALYRTRRTGESHDEQSAAA
jgi:hypothetical protein